MFCYRYLGFGRLVVLLPSGLVYVMTLVWLVDLLVFS